MTDRITDAQRRASAKYNRTKVDRVLVRFPKGELEGVKSFASDAGESVNAFILRAVRDAIAKAKVEEGT